MDDWLDERGLYRKNTALDGSCLFRAVAEQLMPANPVNGHLVLRKQCVIFMRNNKFLYKDRVCGNYEEYVETLTLSKGWGTALELDVISRLYRVEFQCFYGPEPPLKVTRNGNSKELMLCVTDDSFYDAIYTKKHIENLGFCQSIVYRILYNDVFHIEDLDYAVNKMLHDRAARMQRERYLAQKSMERDDVTFDSYLEEPVAPANVRTILDSGAILFPYKVAKALDPDMFRNIEFDVWMEGQRVMRRNAFFTMTSGGNLRVGARCHVKVDNRPLNAYIQELSPDRGPAVVYVEELSQRMVVPFEDLIAIPRFSYKPGWSYSHKLQMIQKFTHKENSFSEDTMPNSPSRQSRSRRSPGGEAIVTSTSSSPPYDANSQFGIREPSGGQLNYYGAGEMLMSSGGSPMESMTPPSSCRVVNYNNEWFIVEKEAAPSLCPDGSDLPFHHVPTMRFFYNMGIEYFNQGTYVHTMNEESPVLCDDGRNNIPSAQLCQGTPLFQPPPPSVPAQIISPIQHSPPPLMTVPPPPVSPIVDILPPVVPTVIETPVSSREGRGYRESRRNARFTKPPRFLRLLNGADAVNPEKEPMQEPPSPPHHYIEPLQEQVAEVSSTHGYPEEQRPGVMPFMFPGNASASCMPFPAPFLLPPEVDHVYYPEHIAAIYPVYQPVPPHF